MNLSHGMSNATITVCTVGMVCCRGTESCNDKRHSYKTRSSHSLLPVPEHSEYGDIHVCQGSLIRVPITCASQMVAHDDLRVKV